MVLKKLQTVESRSLNGGIGAVTAPASALLPASYVRMLHVDVSRNTEKKILAGSLSASVKTNRTAIDYAFGLRSRGSCNCAVLFSCARGLGARELLAEAIKSGKPEVAEAFVIADETGLALDTVPLATVLPRPLR